MSWTDERIETLRQLWEQGLTASQIAEKLGQALSRNAVIGKAHRLGLKARPSPVKSGETTAAAVDTAVVESLSPPAEIPVATPPAAAPAIKKASAPAAPRAIAPAKPGGGKTTLLELSDKICKWPIGHPGEVDFHFCGKGVQPGFPYCGEHCAIAYQAQLPRRDRTPRPLPPVVSNIKR